MPAELEYFDQQTLTTPPAGYLQPLPFVMGPTWVNNDMRVLFVSGSESVDSSSEAVKMNPDPPTGFITVWALDQGVETRGVYIRRLLNGDPDLNAAWAKPVGWLDFVWAPLTIGGTDPGFVPIGGDLTTSMSHNVGDTTLTVDPIAVPAAGEMVLCLWTVPDPEQDWPSWATSLGEPAGWTHISATDKSGDTYDPENTDPAILVVGKKFAAAGTTGTISVPCDPGSHAFSGMWLFVKAAPDVSTTIGAVSETDSVGSITSVISTQVSSSISPVSEVDSVGQVFTGFGGFGLSPAMVLTGLPVTGSRVEWTGAGVFKVETTINGGASWDLATNGDSVPRLKPEDTATRSVQMRISAARNLVTDTSPTLTYLRLAVTDDESTIELVPVGHGVVDKVTRRRSSTDSTGGGGSGGGPGVVGKGGGQTGGGRSLNVHAVDLSKLVSANPWSSGFVVQVGENYVDAAVRMLLNRLPTQTQFRLCTTTKVTKEPYIYGLDQGGDPYKDIKEFLLPASLEPYFDAAGVFVIRQIPDPSVGVPVWTIDDDAHPVITDLSEELTADQTLNYITVKGEGTSTTNPVSGTAFDDNPLSPTYILGDFGEHAVTITLSGLETNDQAAAAAKAILAGSLSGSQVITISMVPNPALEPGDLVLLDLEDESMSGVFLINGMTWSPSQAEPMQLICARQTAAA